MIFLFQLQAIILYVLAIFLVLDYHSIFTVYSVKDVDSFCFYTFIILLFLDNFILVYTIEHYILVILNRWLFFDTIGMQLFLCQVDASYGLFLTTCGLEVELPSTI